MRWVLFCVALQACHAQPELSPDLLLISKIKIRVAENQIRLPNYTCQESTERSRRRAPDRKFELIDTVRLEVALVEGKELFGWPGANRIVEPEISNLVGGTIGNGNFSLLARSIFLSDGALFTKIGEEDLDGRKTIHYEYRVPLLSSGYRLKVPPNEAVVAYHGSFWVDSTTLDLVQLDVTADNIPLRLGLQSSTNKIEYRPTEIGGASFLLPSRGDLVMVDLHGTENRNRTLFHACRQYSGESVLSFADPTPEPSAPAKIELPEIALPDEFEAEIELVTPVDSDPAAVGDAIQARLVRNLKVHGRILAPKGATLEGRITRLEKRSRSYAFVFSFSSLEWAKGHASMAGRDNQLALLSPAGARCGTAGFAPCSAATRALDALEVETHHLQLPRGFRLMLGSRLLKSEKQ